MTNILPRNPFNAVIGCGPETVDTVTERIPMEAVVTPE